MDRMAVNNIDTRSHPITSRRRYECHPAFFLSPPPVPLANPRSIRTSDTDLFVSECEQTSSELVFIRSARTQTLANILSDLNLNVIIETVIVLFRLTFNAATAWGRCRDVVVVIRWGRSELGLGGCFLTLRHSLGWCLWFRDLCWLPDGAFDFGALAGAGEFAEVSETWGLPGQRTVASKSSGQASPVSNLRLTMSESLWGAVCRQSAFMLQ